MTEPISFLNVDLELLGKRHTAPLLGYLKEKLVVLRDTQDAGVRTVCFELKRDPKDIDRAIAGYAALVESLPRAMRTLWNACEDRCLNAGVQSGATPREVSFHLSPGSLAALSRMHARFEITVYAVLKP